MDATHSQAWLELADGHIQWLSKSPCTVGRGVTNSLILKAPGVSRYHAMLQPATGGGYILADLRSTNGTYLNGLRLDEQAVLRDGDLIKLGDGSLTFRCQQAQRQSADLDATPMQIHGGTCWIMLLDLIGHTTHGHNVGAEAAAADFRRWLERIRPVLIGAKGTINAYLGDAIFAYWRQDLHSAERMAATLQELIGFQTVSPRPFRLILHQAEVQICGGPIGESLAGPGVTFLFRIEKSTKGLGASCVISESAAKSLQLTTIARPLGRHLVPGFSGEHAFFALPSG
jgi:class 3 adenylate cyclase